MDLTEARWLEELRRLQQKAITDNQDEEEGFTSQDFARASKTTQAVASRRIGELMDAGLVKFVGKKPRLNRVGVLGYVPVYVVVEKKEEAT